MSKVQPVPEGYHTITPLLNVKGASDAIAFYQKAFGAEERFRFPGPNGEIIQAEIKIGDSVVMVSEAIRNPPTLASLHLFVPDADALWQRATAAGAEVVLPIADQFWGDRYGILSDRWGNRWAIATHKEDLSPEELAKRGAAGMPGTK